jgi:TPR repeat protein
MKRLVIGALILLTVGWFAWKQQDHSPGIRNKEQMVEAEVEQAKKMALAGDGVSATSLAIWYRRRGEVQEADKWLVYSVKAKEPKGMGLYGSGLVSGRIAPKKPGQGIPEAAELFEWAANRRDPYSIFALGALTYAGQAPIKKDRDRGLSYIQDAATMGDPTALKWLKDHPDP